MIERNTNPVAGSTRTAPPDISAVRAAIVGAHDLDAVVAAAQAIRNLPFKLLAAGLTADSVTGASTPDKPLEVFSSPPWLAA